MSEWRRTNWGDLGVLHYGKALRGYKGGSGPVEVFGTNGPIGWTDAQLFPPGVIVGRKGAYRGIHYAKGPCWVIDTAYWLETNAETVDSRWAYWQLRTVDLNAIDSGSAIPSTSRDAFAQISVHLPPLTVQRGVAAVLDSFDDLIENNRRRVKVLEEMARAIYREWFVHFRYPGHEDVPLVDSPLGPIPDGWEASTLGESGRWLSGGTPKTSVAEYWGGSIPWITSGTLTSVLLDRSDRTLTEVGAANGTKVVDRNAVLFVVRGMSLVREFRVGIADVSLAFGQDCKAIVAGEGVEPLYLGFNLIDRAESIQRMVELAGHGTGKLSTDRLKALLLAIPPAEVQRAFVERVTPIRESLTALRLTTDQLCGLRDLLLPKLVTGQIDVSHLELDELAEVASA